MASSFKNPWKKLNSKTVYANPWIEVIHDEVLNPSGKKGIYGTVNFKNLAIGILPVDDELNTYLVGQYRYPLNDYSWEIPEGGCPIKEVPLEAAKRELKEETGLVASVWKELLQIHTSNSVCNEFGICFLATGLSQELASPEDTEELRIKRLPITEAIAMVLRGEITDSLSMTCLLKAKILLDQNLLDRV